MTNQQFALWAVRDAVYHVCILTEDLDLKSQYKKLLEDLTKEIERNPGDQDSVDYYLLFDYLDQYRNICELHWAKYPEYKPF